MYVLTLHNDLKGEAPVESRPLAKGALRIGRANDCDWVIDDPNRLVSRHHLELRVDRDKLSVIALGMNGVSFGDRAVKLPPELEICLRDGDWLRFGTFRLLVAHEAEGQATRSEAVDVTCDPAPRREIPSQYTLFNAFCEGAQIDPSHLIAYDAAQVMKTVGQVYREMIEGLAHLMDERKLARRELGTDRTTVSTQGNNLIKWASAQRQAIDLLIMSDDTFLSGKEAVTAAFSDLRLHLVSLTEGYRSSMIALLDFLRPELLAAQAPHNLLRDRGSEAWHNFVHAHAVLEEEFSNNEDGAIRGAFSEGYDRSMRARRKAA